MFISAMQITLIMSGQYFPINEASSLLGLPKQETA
jgi:hypothetical protein